MQNRNREWRQGQGGREQVHLSMPGMETILLPLLLLERRLLLEVRVSLLLLLAKATLVVQLSQQRDGQGPVLDGGSHCRSLRLYKWLRGPSCTCSSSKRGRIEGRDAIPVLQGVAMCATQCGLVKKRLQLGRALRKRHLILDGMRRSELGGREKGCKCEAVGCERDAAANKKRPDCKKVPDS